VTQTPQPAKAPMEGDRISPAGLALPDHIAPREQRFFISPRWRVRVYCGEVLVNTHEWVSASTGKLAIAHVRPVGYTDAVRYEVTLVEEAPCPAP